ncbi:flavin reductase family protein [Herbaspirillum lusitanum]|uniref:Flavin reductase family protein n=1 Tax=Herbaspirillum lusitanum TaxID=213312 RepID=A0ABW9A7Y8_9BURK
MDARTLFLEAMRHTTAPVAVVTTDGAAGRAGVTVSAVCSLSADPPSILVCIHEMSPVLNIIRRNGCFCVNLLGAEQSHVADSFAGRVARWRDERFACAEWTSAVTGAPVLQAALATLDCALARDISHATHAMLVGEVRNTLVTPGPGLLYVNRGYHSIGAPVPAHAEAFA